MFIGHIPAGYLLTKTFQQKIDTGRLLLIGLVGSLLPDIDVLYFYLIDNRRTLHHEYWIHIPFYWALIAIASIAAILFMKQKKYMNASIIFFANIFLHLLLDTMVGKIKWLYPFTEKAYYLFDVPSVYDFWVYNYIFHWTFLFETAIFAWALYIFLNKNHYPTNNPT